MKTLLIWGLNNLKDWLKNERPHSVFKPQIMVYHTRGLLLMDFRELEIFNGESDC
jgi:hypothetical protein